MAGKTKKRSKSKKTARHASSKKRSTTARAKAPSGLSAKAQFLRAFKNEHATTLKVARAFPAERGSFKPHERSKTALDLSWIFVQARHGGMAALKGQWKFPPEFPPPPRTYGEVVAALESSAQEMERLIEQTPDAKLRETILFITGPKQMGQVPIIDMLWFTLMDTVHHRGQLSVYLRLAGGKVPSIYGPSADDPWS